jgi:hypothetical protein
MCIKFADFIQNEYVFLEQLEDFWELAKYDLDFYAFFSFFSFLFLLKI